MPLLIFIIWVAVASALIGFWAFVLYWVVQFIKWAWGA